MEKFHPPFSERSIEELVHIAHSTTEHWKKDAIFQAKQELIRRNIFEEEQEMILNSWVEEAYQDFLLEQERLERNKTESHTKFEIINLFLFGPLIFFYGLRGIFHFFDLKRENYLLKIKQRIMIFILSFLCWFLFIRYQLIYEEQKRLEEIQKIDISDWKKQHGYD